MSAAPPSFWYWLTDDCSAAENKIACMKRHFAAGPLAFWELIQKTICAAGESPAATDAARREIKEWLTAEKDRNPWLDAIGRVEARASKNPNHVYHTENWERLRTIAARYLDSVVRPLPHVLKIYGRVEAETRPEDTGHAVHTGLRDASFNMVGVVEPAWRFFGDPAIQRRRPVDFPVAAVTNEHGPDGPGGCIVKVTAELIFPGTTSVINHPLLTLGGLDVKNFRTEATIALKAAVGLFDPAREPTAGFYAPEFVRLEGALLDGKSAGGAFALAFEHALAGRPYDPRVLVISTMDAARRPGPVDNVPIVWMDGDGVVQRKTPLQLKVEGIRKHNSVFPDPIDPWRIDTVAVAPSQVEEMEAALADDSIHVVSVNEL